MKQSPDERSQLAQAMAWTSRVTTISLEMALPGLLGHWADQKLGTGMVLLVLGVLFGLGMGMWHLILLTKTPDKGDGPHHGDGNDSSKR